MDGGYKLIRHTIDDEHSFWELSTIGDALSAFEKLVLSKKDRAVAVNLANQIKRILDYGIEVSCKTCKLRKINRVPGLYEVKGYSGVKREMVYFLCRKPPEIVLLFQFSGHQGSGNAHKEIDKAKPLVLAASDLLEKELGNANKGK